MDEYTESLKAANEQLMTCPFCGHSAVIREHRFYSEKSYGVICSDCGATSFQFFPTMGEAVAAWNTRVADAKPVVRGKWEEIEIHWYAKSEDIASMRCSNCHRYYNTVYHYGDPTENANFCPNCGADMRKEANDEVYNHAIS